MKDSHLVDDAAAGLLQKKLESRDARIGVVGLGYVGLPLAVEFAKAGFHVTGIDIDEKKVQRVNSGDSYVGDVSSETLASLVSSGKLRATTDFAAVRDLDTINIAVPTPLRKTKDPDMSFIVPGDCEAFPRGHVDHFGVDDISGHDGRSSAADSAEERIGGGPGFLSLLLARAR